MIRIIKLTENEKEVEIVRQQQPDKFICCKCGCKDINKLYVLHISKPIDKEQMNYIADCFCDDCCPFDMLTKFGNTYYLKEECLEEAATMAKIMQIGGISKNEIVKKILEI